MAKHSKRGRPPLPEIPGGYQRIHLTLPGRLVKRLREIASAERRSLQATIELRLAATADDPTTARPE